MDDPINENLCAVFFLEKKKDSPDDSQGRVPKKDADFWKLIHQLVKSGTFKILDRHAVPPDADNLLFMCAPYMVNAVCEIDKEFHHHQVMKTSFWLCQSMLWKTV